MTPDLHNGRKQFRTVKTIPHADDSERAVIGSCIEFCAETMPILQNKPAELFYDLRNATIFQQVKILWQKRRMIDTVTLIQALKDEKLSKQCGGLPYVMECCNAVTSPANLPYWLQILSEKLALRKLYGVCSNAQERIERNEGQVRELMLGIQTDLDVVSRLGLNGEASRPALTMFKPSELADYNPPPELRLIGDNEIFKGYDGVSLVSGPGSVGKSLAAMTVALAGAGASAIWFGRQVHRRFRTMIIQAENGAIRLKEEFEAIKKHNPGVDLDTWIRVSSPPEGGLPFHKGPFRAAVRDEAAKFKPDLVILDHWAAIAVDDASKDVIEKLGEIRTCFGSGDDFPALMILAHTKKPRAEEVRKGRGLINQVSGSIALANTARTVYMILPWCDEMEDDRVYWACVKLNNGQMYPASVWHRRFGTFFEHDGKTNPKDFGREDSERQKITEDHLRAAFGEDKDLDTKELVRRLMKISEAGQSTAWRAIGEDDYLKPLLERVRGGRVKLREA